MKKTGFCFTGEGARGSIQAGIALSLYEKGVVADYTIGISSGSICSAAYSHLGPNGLVNLWADIKNIFSVFGLNYSFLWKSGLLNQKPMEKIVIKALKNPATCESVVCRMNILDGYLEYVSNKSSDLNTFKEAILGSVAISGLVQDRNGWVDAGSREIAPIEKCVNSGCTDVYLILGRPLFLSKWNRIPNGFLSPLLMGLRALEINLFEILVRDLEGWLGNSTKYDRDKININIVEPTEVFFENTDFYMAKTGTVLGQKNYIIRDSEELNYIFKKYSFNTLLKKNGII
jgi:predicted acylesterase/phospholipase RssA